MNAKTKQTLKIVLKLAFVGALLYFLGKKGFISVEATGKAFSHLEFIVPAFALLLLAGFAGAIRWQWLLRAQGLEISFLRTVQLSYIGVFFNMALPGAVSGDVVKAFYVANELGGQRGRAFGSILFDRVVGLSALVLVSAGAMFADMGELWGSPLLQDIRVIMTLAGVCVLVFYAYLFLVREHHDPLLIFLKKLETKNARFGSATRIYEGTRHYHSHRLTVVKALSLSICVHLIVGFTCLQFAKALGETQLVLLPVYVIVPLGLLVTAVPVAPAGVGTGHAAFAYLFHFLGSARGADIYSLYALGQMMSGAIGGLIYLRFKAAHSIAPLATPAPAEPRTSVR